MDNLILPQGRFPESFVWMSLLEVCQEWGAKQEVTLRTLRVPDWRLGGHGYPLRHGSYYFTPKEDSLKVLC